MNHVAQPTDYRITPQMLSISLNALGDANRLHCGVVGGATIKCYIEDIEGLDYGDNHQYREWPIVIAPTYFNTDTAKYVYAAIPKSPTTATTAMIVFPSEPIDIYGQNESDEQVGSTDFFYIWLQGIITEVQTEDDVSFRQWEQEIDNGLLGTDQSRAPAITGVKVNGESVLIEDGVVDIPTPRKISQLQNDQSFINGSNISAANGIMQLGEICLNLAHCHDWGQIVNKPNLVEGVTVAKWALSFLLSNGDTIQADFSSFVDAISSVSNDVARLTNERGMVITPLVWDATYTGEDWTDRKGEYWFDTTAGMLKQCVSFIEGFPFFATIHGRFMIWNDNSHELILYAYDGTSPSSTTIFTQT